MKNNLRFPLRKNKTAALSLYCFCIAVFLFPSAFNAQVMNVESFEGGTMPPSGWSVSGGYTNYISTVSSGYNPAQSPISGSYELMWNSYNAPPGASADLVSPVIDWSYRGGNTPNVSFGFYRDGGYNTSGYDGEGVNVYVNTTPDLNGATQLCFIPRRLGASASGSYLSSGVLSPTSDGWYQYVLDIPSNYYGSINYIIFDFVSYYGNNSFLDDIHYTSYPNQVTFNANPDTTCAGKLITLNNTSTLPGISYCTWYFGDGYSSTTSGTSSTTHNYTYSGNFSVYLYAYDGSGNYLGYNYGNVTINPGTNGNINLSKDSICPGDHVYIDPAGNGTPLKWTVSDGFVAPGGTYSFDHVFPNIGTYTVSAIFNTYCGNDTISRIVHVTNTVTPNAGFSVNPPAACPNQYIQVSPYDWSGSHSWDFGDGTPVSTSSSPNHKYTSLGTKTITHSVTNSCGNTSTQTYTVSIDNTTMPTTANFNFYPNTPLCPGVQITFNSQNYEGQWSWNFGDGNTATGQNPKHTYTGPGDFIVTQTITNSCGNSLSFSDTLTISDTLSPNAGFSFGPNPACPNDLIGFNPYEQYGKTYSWNFGDGSTSSLKYASHKYTAAGNYAVTLTVKNFCNVQKSYTDTVRVNGALAIYINSNLNAYPQPACHNQPINFDAGVWGFPTYIWNYGDGVIDTTSNAYSTHSYASAGTFTASVTIANNCGKDTTIYKAVLINSSIPFPAYAVSATPSSVCPGENVSLGAPWGFPTYTWNMGDGSPVFASGNAYMNYAYGLVGTKNISVKITDYCGNDSTYTATVDVANRTYFCTASCSLNVWANSPSCPNSPVNLQASQGYAWYNWKFGDGDSLSSSSYQATHTYTAQGTYSYTLTITNFCGKDTTIFNQVTIDNSQQVSPWTNIYAYPDIVCPSQPVQLQTDNSYSSYHWDFGDGYSAYGSGTVSHTYTVSGTYNPSVTITNACGNTATVTTTITVDPSATFPNWMNMWNYPDPACPGSPVTMQTTAGYASYFWNFGDGDTVTTTTEVVTHMYAAAGNYSASVLVSNSCGTSVTLYKTIAISNTVTIGYLDLYVPNNPACVGDVVMMNPNSGMAGGGGGGNAGMTFSWDYGDGSALDTTIGVGTSHAYAAPGVYNVVLTAINTCGNSKTVSKLVTINGSATPSLTPWSFGAVAGNGNNNSSVSVCPGDVVLFYFEGNNPNNVWDFGDGNTGVATDIVIGDNGGTYTIIKHAYTTTVTTTYNYSLTLGNHCGNSTSLSKPITVTSGMLINGSLMIQAPSGTIGYTTCGLISFVASGGKYFDWDFGDGTTLSTLSPTADHSYVNAGNYTVKVTITNGCGNSATYTKTLIINGTGGTVVNAAATSSPTCSNGTDGSASVTVSGGQAPYSYNWKDALGQSISTTASASNLASGSYTVTVTDNSGCAGNTTITLNNPAAITMTVSTAPSSCGGSTGSATVANISGGTAPFTYTWSNGQSGATATGLAIGTYSVMVTDNKNCTSSANASVSENGASLTVSSTTSVTCSGGTNGAIDISISGGSAPFTYAWSNGATTQNISGVAAGTYSVVVTDNGGCHSTISTSISEASALNVNAVAGISPTCGNHDGSVIANVTGGTAPYTYLWSGGGSNSTKTGLYAGNYTVTVTDAHGCSKNGVVTLSNSNAPNVTAVVSNISCNGLTDGSISLTVSGGTGPYGFSWNTGSFDQNVTGLSTGFYFVQILDGAGCNSFRSYNITQPLALSGTATFVGATCGNNDGTATATPAGGTSPYTYSWSGGGQTTQTATGLALGGYTATITDSKGCTATASTTVTPTVQAASICMVTVDPLSTHNIVYWDKTGLTGIDSFRIYREDVTNVYTHIGSVSVDSLSEYHDYDAVANPNTTTKRYKISSVDACGLESAKSNYHNTIYIVSVGSGQFTWNPVYTIENSANPVNNYVLMRDDNSTGSWNQVASTAGTQNTITDVNYATYPNASYYVATSWGISCSPTRAIINTSRSNIKSIANPLGITTVNLSSEITVAPNPVSNDAQITAPGRIISIELYNSIGQLIISEQVGNTNSYTVSFRELAAGVYHLKVRTAGGVAYKKILKEN